MLRDALSSKAFWLGVVLASVSVWVIYLGNYIL